VDLVRSLLDRHGIDADTHSDGETVLAHSARHMTLLREQARNLGKAATLIEQDGLVDVGLGGPFHGALSIPVGFALNPRKYLGGLAQAAEQAGADLHAQSHVTGVQPGKGGYDVRTAHGTVRATRVIVATNGYGSETVPKWLAGRYMPTQSTVMVTRPIEEAELQAQGWTSDQMAYDTRNLLHYFRLMPDRRFLFGMRGGLIASPRAERQARLRLRRDFDRMFPAWRGVETTHAWSGFVCLSRARVPFAGPVPGEPGLLAGFAYHGNGVAMGTFVGRLLADLALGRSPADPYPAPLREPPKRFPFGRHRRWIMPALYGALRLGDL
jgi:glycine/D-amino acid oxidase-like deaminating enzyme